YADSAWLVTPEVNLMLTGWVDALSGSRGFTNVEALGDWHPSDEFDLRLGIGRFSTVIYQLSSGTSFVVDGSGNKASAPGTSQTAVIVDENGNPIVPFNAALISAAYDQVRARGGYRLSRQLEIFGSASILIRDTGAADALADQIAPGNTLTF